MKARWPSAEVTEDVGKEADFSWLGLGRSMRGHSKSQTAEAKTHRWVKGVNMALEIFPVFSDQLVYHLAVSTDHTRKLSDLRSHFFHVALEKILKPQAT